MSEPEFAAFVTDHASVVHGLVLLVTGEREATDAIVDAAWPEVYERWPAIARSPRRRAHALAPFVSRAVRYAETARRHQQPAGATALELRDELVVDASPVRSTRTTSDDPRVPPEEGVDPRDDAIRRAFDDLTPRERALVALSLVVGLGDTELPWALRWRPVRAARVMRRAVRDLTLTAAPVVLGVTPPDDGSRLRDRVARALAPDAAPTGVGATDTLQRLGPRLATVTQRRPFPRPVLVAAGVGAVALALVLAVVVALHDDEKPEPASLTAKSPMPGPGMQLVGYGAVYASVPASWGHNQLECGAPVTNTVLYPDATSGCPGETPVLRDVAPSSVTFSELPTSAVPLGRLTLVNQVGELGVYATTPVHRDGRFHQIVLVPQADVQMIVRATDIHVMDDIVDSLALVPAGYTVVPPCQRLPLRQAIEELDDAELAVKLIQASTLSGRETEPPVTRQTIVSGAIVETGTVVGLGFPSMN